MLLIFVYMQIPAEDLIYLVSLASLIFLIAPLFLVLYVMSYNSRKKKDAEERMLLRKTFETELVRANMEVREQTMQSIGTELHDNIGQLLGLTSLTLRSVEIANPDKAKEKIEIVDGLISRSIAELRQLGKVIQGDQLLKNGIAKAIEYELDFMKSSGLFSISFINTADISDHSADKDLILFRLLQETLNNIIKHSLASGIVVNLMCENGILILSVRDNGVGFSSEKTVNGNTGMGLLNMQRRAAIIGAVVSVRSAPGEGTEVLITIPYP